MLRLWGLGGVGEIGGNKLLLEGGDSGVFLDFGVSMSVKRRFFSLHLRPRTPTYLSLYLMTGVIPRLGGIYREDLLRIDSPASSILDKAPKPRVDACIVSHAHIDHYGHVSLLSPNIPIYMGSTTHLLIKHRQETSSQRELEGQVLHYRDVEDNVEEERRVATFRTGDKIRLGGFTIRPIHVDHSIPASYGFVIEWGGQTIAYTGDFRMHGPKSELTWDFVEEARGVDALLVEGTRIGEVERVEERDVERDLDKWVKSHEGKLVSIMVSEMDFDRLQTVIRVAEENGRSLILPVKVMKMLESLKTAQGIKVPSLGDNVSVLLDRRGSGRYDIERDYRGWMRKTLQQLHDKGVELISGPRISKNQSKYILVLSRPESITELAWIKPEPGSPLILSTSEPHNEEQEIEREKLMNWAALLGLKVLKCHASGHAEQGSILRLISEIGAKTIIPIHTEDEELFSKLVSTHMPGSRMMRIGGTQPIITLG